MHHKRNFFSTFFILNHNVYSNSHFWNYKYNILCLEKVSTLYIRISIFKLNIGKGLFFKSKPNIANQVCKKNQIGVLFATLTRIYF